MNRQIEKAATLLGGQTKAASLLVEYTGVRITQGNIWSWIHRTETVPAHIAPYFEELTEKYGEPVRKEDLCPDFPWAKCCPKNCQEGAVA